MICRLRDSETLPDVEVLKELRESETRAFEELQRHSQRCRNQLHLGLNETSKQYKFLKVLESANSSVYQHLDWSSFWQSYNASHDGPVKTVDGQSV